MTGVNYTICRKKLVAVSVSSKLCLSQMIIACASTRSDVMCLFCCFEGMLETFLSDTFLFLPSLQFPPESYSVTLKMEAACSSETSEHSYHTKHYNLSNNCRANLRMHIPHQTIHKILLKQFFDWVNIFLSPLQTYVA